MLKQECTSLDKGGVPNYLWHTVAEWFQAT